MTDPVAAVIGILTTVLMVTIWNVVTGILPGRVGLEVNLIALVVALITGFVTYHSFSRNR